MVIFVGGTIIISVLKAWKLSKRVQVTYLRSVGMDEKLGVELKQKELCFLSLMATASPLLK